MQLTVQNKSKGPYLVDPTEIESDFKALSVEAQMLLTEDSKGKTVIVVESGGHKITMVVGRKEGERLLNVLAPAYL